MDALIGRWRLRLGVDVPWHEHTLDIVHVDGDDVSGYVAIDWRARPSAPGAREEPDHRVHHAPWRGALDERCGLRFEIAAGAILPRRYRFELFLVDALLVGFVDVARDTGAPVWLRIGVHASR